MQQVEAGEERERAKHDRGPETGLQRQGDPVEPPGLERELAQQEQGEDEQGGREEEVPRAAPDGEQTRLRAGAGIVILLSHGVTRFASEDTNAPQAGRRVRRTRPSLSEAPSRQPKAL